MANIRSAPHTSFILLLAVLASSVAAASKLEFAKTARELSNELLETISSTDDDKLRDFWKQLTNKDDDKDPLILGQLGGAVRVVTTGSHDFPVGGVDVTSAVTWTSNCAAAIGSRPVSCGDPLCDKYGDGSQQCGNKVCSGGGGSLLQGAFSLSTYARRQAFSGDNDTVYACSPAGTKGTAVVGLSRDSIVATSSKRFAYNLKDGKLGSFLWLGNDVPATTGGSSSTTTKLISVDDTPEKDASLYYVNVTGIKVGDDGSVKADPAAGIMVTTTIPFTFLNPVLYDHLKQKLSSAGEEEVKPHLDAKKLGRQLCYASGTKLPAIALVFAGAVEDGAAIMKMEPEHYSYKRSQDGAVCLAILQSPLRGGTTIIGTMVQVGRRMTYDLRDDTLTFDSFKPSLSSSNKTSSAALTTPVFFLSTAWWVASLLIAVIVVI
jgi:hypothetical protein